MRQCRRVMRHDAWWFYWSWQEQRIGEQLKCVVRASFTEGALQGLRTGPKVIFNAGIVFNEAAV